MGKLNFNQQLAIARSGWNCMETESGIRFTSHGLYFETEGEDLYEEVRRYIKESFDYDSCESVDEKLKALKDELYRLVATLSPAYVSVLEKQGWTIVGYTGDGRVQIEKLSPLGERIMLCLDTVEFMFDLKDRALNFNPYEHASAWVVAKKEHNLDYLPASEELYKDAIEIFEMLTKLSDAIIEA